MEQEQKLTITLRLPQRDSRLTKYAAANKMRTVMGIAAIVAAISPSVVFDTMTRNCTEKPRKKKKSNFSRAI